MNNPMLKGKLPQCSGKSDVDIGLMREPGALCLMNPSAIVTKTTEIRTEIRKDVTANCP